MNILRLFLFLVTPLFLWADPTVCLNMIVKNESHVITRCIDSVSSLIDYWVIVDTGSTDGTQKIIQDHMKKLGIPGELHERPWVDFGHNRNEALALAKGKADYLFFIDADDYMAFEAGFEMPKLEKDYYMVNISRGGTDWDSIRLVKSSLPWKYEGVLHEVLVPQYSYSYSRLPKATNLSDNSGARSKDPQKFIKDAQVLEKALLKEPDSQRYVFYLAQTYRDAGMPEKALENYQKRVAMGGWDQEVYMSLLQIAFLNERLQKPHQEIVQGYLNAFEYRPQRAETLYSLAAYLRGQNDHQKAYQVASLGMTIPLTTDTLFVQKWQYTHGLQFERSISSYWLGKYEESFADSDALFKSETTPDWMRPYVVNNLDFARRQLLKTVFQAE